MAGHGLPSTPAQAAHSPVESPFPGMVWIPGGTFLMGSDSHYPEEAPVHRVSVDGFWIDRTPVTNADFVRFLDATGYRTYAEIPPRAEEYPGAIGQVWAEADVHGAAAAMRNLAGDPALAERLGTAGQELIRRRYNAAAVGKRYVERLRAIDRLR